MLDKNAITNAAKKYAARGQIDDAIAEWSKLAEVGKDGNVHNTIGDLYLKKGSQSEAVDSFSRAADIFREEGFYPKSIALYKKVLNLVPHKLDARIALAELNAERGFNSQAAADLQKIADKLAVDSDNEKALEVYEKALRVSPFDINIKIKIADLSNKLGQKERALKGYGLIASEYLEKGEHATAETFYKKALELDQNNLASLVGLSSIAEQSDNTDLAFDLLSKAVSIGPDDRSILLAYSNLAIKVDNIEEAQNTLLKLVEADPSDIDVKKLLGALYIKEDQIENAWEELESSIDNVISAENWSEALDLLSNFHEIKSIPVMQRLIDVYRGKGDNEVLIIELKELAGLYEKQDSLNEALNLYKELAELVEDDGVVKGKIQELENALGSAPLPRDEPVSETPVAEETPVEEVRSDSPAVTDGPEEAKAVEQGSETESSENFNERKTEADFYAQQGLADEAVNIYEELLNSFPGNEEIESALNVLKVSGAGTQSEAAETIERVPLEIEPEQADSPNSMNSAMNEILQAMGGPDGNDAAQTGETDYEACFQAAMNFKRDGLLDEAIGELKKTSDDPDNIIRNSRMLALCYVEKGLYGDAAGEFRKVVEAMSSDESGYFDTLYELAEACFNNNDNDDAQRAYNEIYDHDPMFRDISQKLEILKTRVTEVPKSSEPKPKTKKSRISYL
ncbi:MAG: tetratricopeptide repeat protein [Nitrospirota bacterium]